MLKRILRRKSNSPVLLLKLMLLCALANHAAAEIIDDITLRTDANGEIDAVVEFAVPVQYVRHFPTGKSLDMVIYFNILGSVPRSEWQNYESHRSPPSDQILGFTITTRDLASGPKIAVHFRHPAEFRVTPYTDRSILLHIKPEAVQQKEARPGLDQTRGAVTPPVIPAPPAIAARPAAVPPSQLGGKEGLPAFPRIEPAAPGVVAGQPAGPPSVAEQVRKINNQAAAMMAKGRDALLAGQMFAAISAFNDVLKLPPNKYSPDAQVWIGIARERAGQLPRAISEYEAYLKLYPDGTEARWVKERLARLQRVRPAPPAEKPAVRAAQAPPTEFQTTAYGSLSTYYYHGASQTDSIATIGNIQTPTTLSLTDQSSLMSNVILTARSYNNQFDNRFVFQDFYAASYIRGQPDRNRLNAAYYDVRNRPLNYSARVGRQSAIGGGVLGRFDGLSAGYGFLPSWRANVTAGRLSEITPESRPRFFSTSMDFGVNNPLGGSAYVINQNAGGIPDRRAAGGYLRYFEQGSTAMAMFDYDTQFKAWNMLTLQGTLHQEPGTDFNYLLDRRKIPSLSIRNAVTGTTARVDNLIQNGWTQDDLLMLAKKRTAVSGLAMFGATWRIQEKWQLGTDISVTNTSGLPASGTLIPDGTTGVEGYVAATPSSGKIWTVNGRVSGSDVIAKRDMSMCTLSYSRSPVIRGRTILLYNRAYLNDLWTLDTTLRFFHQSDNSGGKVKTVAPVLKVGYQIRGNLVLEAEGGIDRTKSIPAALPVSDTTRRYYSLGFRWDF